MSDKDIISYLSSWDKSILERRDEAVHVGPYPIDPNLGEEFVTHIAQAYLTVVRRISGICLFWYKEDICVFDLSRDHARCEASLSIDVSQTLRCVYYRL